jgi:hypothetical protein
MQVKSKEYQQHEIFKKLDDCIEFYRLFSDLIMMFITMGTSGIINIDTYVYSSMKGTLFSIKTLIKQGQINDAYALLRKFYDSVYINVYTMLYLDDHFRLEEFTVKQIQDWLSGKQQLPAIRKISDYIRKSKKLEDLNNLLYKDKSYGELRDRCNDNAHYNFYQNVLLNDSQIYNPARGKALNALSADITKLFIMHLSYIFSLSQHYMSSNDHLNYLEMGETPPDNSQYWVAPFIQNIFDKVIKTHRPDIADLILEKTDMHLK